MEKFLMVDINLFAALVCLLILLDVSSKAEKKFKQSIIYIVMLIATIALLMVDLGAWITDGNPAARFFTYTFNFLLYILEPLPIFLWVFYVTYQIHNERRITAKMVFLSAVPYLAFIALVVANVFNGEMFYVDAAGYYHRGALFFMFPFTAYFYVAYSYVLIFKNKKKIDRRSCGALLSFAIPPVVGGVLQSFFYGTLLICPGMALSMLIIYLNLQNNRICTDYLTGAFNRREADGYIRSRIKNREGGTFSAIMLDIDRFKAINDRYGHAAGDNALETVTALLKSALRSEDFIARYGGDEFLIVLDIPDKRILEAAVRRVRTALDDFNKNNTKPYALSLSMGYGVYDRNSGMDEEQFVRDIDALLYEDKARNRGEGI